VTRVILLVGAMLLAGWIYYFQTDAGREGKSVAVAVPARPVAAMPAPVTVIAEVPVSPVVTDKPAPAPPTASGTPGNSASDTRPEWIRNPPDLGLTRLLAGDQAVSYDGRARTLLGTKEGSAQPVLLVRDDTSGQIDYFQSGLTFRLKPGSDFEAFIRERKAMQRYFSNTDYATVMVDAGSIASEYKALQSDPRVTLVTFLKLKTLTNPR
jgi:hypothetical protein